MLILQRVTITIDILKTKTITIPTIRTIIQTVTKMKGMQIKNFVFYLHPFQTVKKGVEHTKRDKMKIKAKRTSKASASLDIQRII